MTPVQIAAVMMVGSGATHAVVNAILKSGKDKMSSRALIDGFSAILVLPAIVLLPRPDGAWIWLAGSWITHLLYLICLVKAFEHGDMSTAYPISRGTAPVLAAISAVGLFGAPISVPVVAGVLLVSLGTLTIAFRHHADRRSIGWAVATGATIAAYTVIDAQGVRASPNPFSYIAWVFLALGGGIGLIFALWRGPKFILAARSEWRPGLAAGALSILTYGLALLAYRLGDVPRLAALRETSILFGVGIAVVFLKEKVSRVRALGAATIAAGAVVLLALG